MKSATTATRRRATAATRLCQSEVACPVTQTGDVNVSGAITSADIIYMVNHVFKGGQWRLCHAPPPAT